ncbi:MAG TPA: phosphotransferase [Polyangiaceae bacterium]|jgi:aminoglycoside/choline kinase family phosphotransferase|nr:phosphotransferase [Polyangiaceae bacterium]
MTDSSPPFDALSPLLEEALGTVQVKIEEMAGGASTRRFFRVATGNGRSAVAMYVPLPSQELSKARESGRRWPFLEVRDLLASQGIRVPALLAEACPSGWLLVEDLGETLAQHLEHSPQDKPALYQRAVRDLANAQRALKILPGHSIVLQRAFDADLLRWEIDHFREWALEARGIELSAAERAVFARATEYLATTIAAWPRGFVHRDYQSRNLMVLPNGAEHALAWIDFQDAMLGPRVYDLVALLGDSYQSFDRAFIDARLAEFAQHMGFDVETAASVAREFDMVTVQRKLKDAGRFVFIERKNKNPSFLKFVEPTIEKARASLSRLQDDAELRPLAALLDGLFSRSQPQNGSGASA